jgi:hypothetical protein
MADDDIWKRRFMLFMGARLFGVLTFFAGLAIGFTNLVTPGGSPAVGAVLIVFGVLDAVVAPRLMTKRWKKEDGSAGDRPGSGRSDR